MGWTWAARSTRPLQAVQGGNAVENAGFARQILQKENHPARDFVVANAALGIYVAGKAATLKEGVARAAESIDSGRACDVLNNLVEYTNQP